MPLIKLTSFVDITAGGFVTGVLSQERVAMRALGQADKILWAIQFVEKLPDQGYVKPYTVVPVTGLSLSVGIGFVEAAPLCEQDTWTYDATSNFVRGALDLDTASMRAAFTSGVDLIQPVLEFQITDSDGRATPIHEQISVFRQILISGSPGPGPAGATYYTSNQMDGLYVKRVGKAGEGRIIVSPDGTKAVFEYLGNDGSMHYDPVDPSVAA